MTRLGVVINPISGRRGSRPGEADRRRDWVTRAAAARGLDLRVSVTARAGHARELAAQALQEGCEVVAAMGGDGTVNEVAQALVGSGVPLGVLPCGSGDGLARGLQIPANLSRAFSIVVDGRTRAMDVGYVNDQPFLNVLGLGFDAAVGELFAKRSTRGAWGYIVNSAKLVWSYRALDYTLVWAEGRRSGPLFLLGVANLPEYGNGAVLAPGADPSDGQLDVILADAGSPWRQIWRARRLFWRHHAPAEGITRFRLSEATVTGARLLAHLDGEVCELTSPAHIRVAPSALQVRVP